MFATEPPNIPAITNENRKLAGGAFARELPDFSRDPVRACETTLLLVADALQVPAAKIVAPTRGSARSAHARQAAMYLAHVALGASLTAIGRYFGRDHSTVAHGCRQVEDRRDHPEFDLLVAELALAARLALNLDGDIAA